MNKFYAYTRVSTLKQGEKGVSLQEQHGAIARYAERQRFQIIEWFEERLTAAKQGRPLFAKMLKGLRSGAADGVIIHKIDRSTRNLRDWADLGELIDAGVAVHFANEGLDLHSRGGRLSADIQAVVASDYIRNLREEARKGIYGRLKQGIYPFGAPLGYVDMGGGRVKEVDPVRAPLVIDAFERYATGRYTLDSLLSYLYAQGLRTKKGRALSRAGLSGLLNNPFYAGLIRIRTTSEVYQGAHTPLVSMSLFKQVGGRLAGRIRAREWTHDFVFRGLFECSQCHRVLVGERQKGHSYYRCHTRGCVTKTFREEVLEDAVLRSWPPIAVTEHERQLLLEHLTHIRASEAAHDDDRRASVTAQIGKLKARLDRMVDAYVDGALDRETFLARKATLLEEQLGLEQALTVTDSPSTHFANDILEMLELASSAQHSYRLASVDSRREMVIKLSSNRSVSGKKVVVEPCLALTHLASIDSVHSGGHHRNATRTLEQVARQLWDWAKEGVEPWRDASADVPFVPNVPNVRRNVA